MTDHHDELRVAPDPSRAEELRRRLHERLASGSGHAMSDADPDDRDGDLLTLETEGRSKGDQLVVPRRSSSGWLLAAAAAVVVAVVGTILITVGGEDDDEIGTVTATPTTAESPFVGVWLSTDSDGLPQTMYIDQWDTGTYRVRVRDEAGAVCVYVGQLASDTSLVVVRRAHPTNRVELLCDDGTGSIPPPPPPELEFTLDQSTAPDQLVDGAGVVWRKQAAPPPDAEDAAVLQTFLEARVAGEGAEQYLGSASRDDQVPLLYAATSGAAYERFEIERFPDPDGGATYNVRLFSQSGTVVQQGFVVFDHTSGDQRDQLVVAYIGPTLEDGRAVLRPFGLLDGAVRYGVSSTWEVEWVDDAVGAFRHRFLSSRIGDGSSIVIAAEPLGVGGSCENRPAPANAEALAQMMAATDSGYEVSEPVPVRIAGIDGLQLDVAVPDPLAGYLCTFEGSGTLSGVQSMGGRMRLFLVDRPESGGILTIAVMTEPDDFEDTLADAAPILDSIDFQPD